MVFYLSIFEIIMQLISIIKYMKTNKERYWNITFGISTACIICFLLLVFILDTNKIAMSNIINYFSFSILIWFVFGCSLLFFIICVIYYILSSVKLIDKNSILICLLFILINLFVLIVLPNTKFEIKGNINKGYVINYLNERYGKSNYYVTNVYYKIDTRGTLADPYLSNYYYEIKCDYMKEKFFVSTNSDFSYIESDYFVPLYYSSMLDLKYEINYKDNYLDYDFSEFDKYIAEQINIRDTDIISTLYNNYQEHFAANKPASFRSGKIPTVSDLKDIVQNRIK